MKLILNKILHINILHTYPHIPIYMPMAKTVTVITTVLIIVPTHFHLDGCVFRHINLRISGIGEQNHIYDDKILLAKH